MIIPSICSFASSCFRNLLNFLARFLRTLIFSLVQLFSLMSVSCRNCKKSASKSNFLKFSLSSSTLSATQLTRSAVQSLSSSSAKSNSIQKCFIHQITWILLELSFCSIGSFGNSFEKKFRLASFKQSLITSSGLTSNLIIVQRFKIFIHNNYHKKNFAKIKNKISHFLYHLFYLNGFLHVFKKVYKKVV